MSSGLLCSAALYTLVVIWILMLGEIYRRAHKSSQRALDWCAEQQALAGATADDSATEGADEQNGDEPSGAEEEVEADGAADEDEGDEAASSPPESGRAGGEVDRSPLGERKRLLRQLHDTAIAEGQLVSLLLKRDEIEGQHDAAEASHSLVVWALFGTIIGLFLTLFWLGRCIALTAQAGDMTTVDIIQSVQDPLKHLPFLFLPTAAGLVCAIGATRRQRQIDREVELTWERLDDVTLENLLPRYFRESTRAAQRRAVSRLHEASGRFSDAAGQIREAMAGIESSLEQIKTLDQSKWAQDLTKAADIFRDHVQTSSENLEKASGEIGAALGEIPASTGALAEASLAMTDAAGRVAETTQQTAGALEAVGGTLEPLTALPDSVDRFSGSVDRLSERVGQLTPSIEALRALLTDWTTEQQKWLREAVEAVDKLDDTMKPMIDEARGLHDETKVSREQTLQALDGIRGNLDRAGAELGKILAAHDNTLAGLPHGIEEAIRAGHEAWVVEVGGRFDQNEQLFVQLSRLADQLGACRSAFDAAAELARDVSGPGRELVEVSRAALLSLDRSITDLRTTVAREDEWTRPETWRDMLRQHTGELREALAPLSALEGLQGAVGGLSSEVRALRTEIDRVLRPRGFTGRIIDWLRGGPRRPSGPPGLGRR